MAEANTTSTATLTAEQTLAIRDHLFEIESLFSALGALPVDGRGPLAESGTLQTVIRSLASSGYEHVGEALGELAPAIEKATQKGNSND